MLIYNDGIPNTTERTYLNIMRKNQFLKVKNSLLELEKDFTELRDVELKDREVKKKKEELLFKPIIVSIDDMNRFEKKGNEENKTN